MSRTIPDYEDKFISIKHIESKPKTEVYDVWSKCSETFLGRIEWYPKWRHYVFTDDDLILSDRCLLELCNFVSRCNRNHREVKNVQTTQSKKDR